MTQTVIQTSTQIGQVFTGIPTPVAGFITFFLMTLVVYQDISSRNLSSYNSHTITRVLANHSDDSHSKFQMWELVSGCRR